MCERISTGTTVESSVMDLRTILRGNIKSAFYVREKVGREGENYFQSLGLHDHWVIVLPTKEKKKTHIDD